MKPFTRLAVLVFAIVACVQLLRLLLDWEVTIAGVVIPFWASIIASAVAALLAFGVWRESRR